jgi:tRNA-2-methylthio-N6-dimethylallyladenosine synthase
MTRRVYIETYGCQMNENDSERMLRLLEASDYAETRDPGKADLILINTCSVREKPEHKVYSALGRFRELKNGRGPIIGVTGCVAQQEGQRLLKRVPYLDLVVGTHAIPSLPQLVHRVEVLAERVCETKWDPEGQYLKAILPRGPAAQVKSYVTIMQGCDHFCSFCIVPYVRGRERSRSSEEIVEEVKHLAERGVKEVCLLGQNVNAYGKGSSGEVDFPDLLREINRIEGIDRIRFTTSHPMDLSTKLIESFGTLEKLCDHIHLPFQSGSDRILERMHRGYTQASYLEKIGRLRRACPSVAITSDALVGFPGEEEKDFEETLDLLRRVRFDELFSFKFSSRKGTRAARFEDQVEPEIKRERLSILQKLQQEITLEKNEALKGSSEEVLVEGPSKQNRREMTGRTRSNKTVNFEGGLDQVGKRVLVEITKAYAHSLRGRLI